MPECLKKFLESLDDDQADILWKYFDEDPTDAAIECCEVIGDSHPNFD